MCLYPKFIRNKKYASARARALCDDYRKLYVPVGCGNCYECRKQKANAWRVRLMEEIQTHKHCYFVTLTFSNESLIELGEKHVNAAATLAVRRFLERYRKHYKHSLKHWLITELGHENTERIHLHGIIFDEEEWDNEKLFKFWKYGKCDTGQYCNERTINYIIKYVTKIDTNHKNYRPIILCSAGLGANFVNKFHVKQMYKYEKGKTPEYYMLNDGKKVALPIYYRNKLFSEKEREKMWMDRLDKHTIFVNGIELRGLDKEKNLKTYYNVLKTQQEWNKSIGYGDTSKEWQKEEYNITLKMLNKEI